MDKNKRQKKWFIGGGPFSKINKLTTDLKMLEHCRDSLVSEKARINYYKYIFKSE